MQILQRQGLYFHADNYTSTVDKTLSFGGTNVEIKLTGDYFDTTLKSAIDFSKNNDATFLSPFDDLAVIEGQATVLDEILDQSGP